MKLAVLILVASVRIAAAHDVRGEAVLLDIGDHAVDAEVHVSRQQLDLARGAATPPVATLVGARTADGRPFTASAGAPVIDRDDLVFRVHLQAPPGATARWFAFHDELMLGRVTSANVYVFIRSDLQTGVAEGAPSLAGTLHYQRRELVLDRTSGSLAHAFFTVFELGARHIRTGTDHVVFLLVLLVAAPLTASRGRWRGRRDIRDAVIATARIVSSFTLGHSLTLFAGTVHGAILPARIVESLIALSILVTAVHAARPLFPGREAMIAASFGLIHGLAFASTLATVGVDRASLAIGILGFNLGVEAMQLGIVVVAVPWLLVLARRGGYRWFRLTAAAGSAVAAVVWLAQRILL